MKKKIKNKRISISITLDSIIIDILKLNFENKSKFIEYCLIKELYKNNDFKEQLKNNLNNYGKECL